MIHWTPELRAFVPALRNNPDFPAPTRPDVKESWKAVTSKRKSLGNWERPRVEAVARTSMSRLDGTPTSEDLSADTTLLAGLFTVNGELSSRWLTWMWASFGPEYCIKAIAGALPTLLDGNALYSICTRENTELIRGIFANIQDDATCDRLAALFAPVRNRHISLEAFLIGIHPDPIPELSDQLWANNAEIYASFMGAMPDTSLVPRLFCTDLANPGYALLLIHRLGKPAALALAERVTQILATNSYFSYVEPCVRALAACDIPEVGPVLFAGLKMTNGTAILRGWLQRNPDSGLPLLAASTHEAAPQLLKEFARSEHDRLFKLIPSLTPEHQKRLTQILARTASATEATPDLIPAGLRGKATIPAWCVMAELPEVLLKDGKHFLTPDAHAVLAEKALAGQPIEASRLDSSTLTAFLMAILKMWQRSDSKVKNILFTIGKNVDDAGAKAFMKLVEGWASSSGGFHDAKTGLQGLAMRGDSGLRLVHRMSQKAKSQGLRRHASGALETAARERKLSRVELEDRLVPDFEIGATGVLELDFGPRKFYVSFDESLKPVATDEAGKILKDLPKPIKTDDAEKSEEATNRWKQLKKDVREIASMQLARLEQAMVDERQWPHDAFLDCFVRHPVLQHLARRILWETVGAGATRFRVAEDGSLADLDDNPYTLPAGKSVRIAHPCSLGDAEKSAWTTLFSDYKLIQPFEQLGRPVFALTDEEKKGNELSRFVGMKSVGGKLLGQSSKPNWQRGYAEDNGFVRSIFRTLTGTERLEVHFSHGFGITGGYGTDEDQTIEKVTFRSTNLGRLSPVMASEILKELEGLRKVG